MVCATGQPVPDGAEVVVALDGSFSDDTTALLLGTVSPTPHFDVLRVWERPSGDPGYRVPVAEVENTIRDACRRWQVVEIIADPFRWTRTLQAFEAERLPVVEFPHSPSRLTAATTDLYSAAVNGPNHTLGQRRSWPRTSLPPSYRPKTRAGCGWRRRSRSRNAAKIDLAACLVMAHVPRHLACHQENTTQDKEFRMTLRRTADKPCCSGLDEPAARYAELDLYYRGSQPLAYPVAGGEGRAGQPVRSDGLQHLPGWPSTALAERLRITGFTGDTELWADWIRNDLDQTSAVSRTARLCCSATAT